MSKISLRIILTVISIGLIAGATRADDGDGGYAGAFFQIPIGARPTALGGAYLSISNDGAAPLFNPAGLATIRKKMFASSYRAMSLDRSLGYLTLMIPTRDNSALGVNWHYFSTGDVEMRNRDGRLTGHSIGLTSHAWSIIFAKRFENYLSIGLRAGYLHSSFAEMNANSIGIDIGLMLYVSQFFDRERRPDMALQDIQVGLVIRNLGTTYRWNSTDYNSQISGNVGGTEQEDIVPIEGGLGISSRFLQRKLLLTTDIIASEKQNLRLHTGAEFFVSPEFALRAGYSDRRLTAGTGYVFQIGTQVLAIDYAFATDRVDEGSEHIFSFDILF
ncbi:MAG: PorV/PorQ family protein [candidate division Zixibacteria bacterium]|nr:PorV/PorQ family protein [candidate division Zixibacteria bacterium]